MTKSAADVPGRAKTIATKLTGGALLWIGLAALTFIPFSGGDAITAVLVVVGFLSFAGGLVLFADAFKREVVETDLVCRAVPERTQVRFEVGDEHDAESELLMVVEGTVRNTVNGYPIAGTPVALHAVAAGGDATPDPGEDQLKRGQRLADGATDPAGRFRLVVDSPRLPASLSERGSELVVALEDGSGNVWHISDRHRAQERRMTVELSVPLPLRPVAKTVLEDLAARIKSARASNVRQVVRHLIFSPGDHSLFGDWDLQARHAILAEMERSFLDPEGVLRAFGDLPGFHAARRPGAIERYEERLGPHMEDAGVRRALELLVAKVETFRDLSAVDWVINPDSIHEGDLGKGLTFFQDYYTEGDTGGSTSGPDLTEIASPWYEDIDLDLVNYRDYLRALWAELATQELYSDPPPAADANAAVKFLNKRFHQNFYTSSTSPAAAHSLLLKIVRAILTAPTGSGYGFGIAPAAIQAQGDRTDQEYLEYLVDLAGLPVDRIERTYRIALRRRDDAVSNPVQENISTLQRLFSDAFQCKHDDVVPAKIRGWAPFYLQYDEWLSQRAPFFGENHYQFRLPMTLALKDIHRETIANWSSKSGVWSWLQQVVELESTLHAAMADHTTGQYALALDNYWQAHALARVTLGADENEVREVFAKRRDLQVADLSDVAQLTHWSFAPPTNQPMSMSLELSDWEEHNHIRLKATLHHAHLFAIPACIADTALALGDYRLAVSALSWLTGFFLGLADPAKEAGYFEGYYNDLLLYFDGGLPYTVRSYSMDDEKRQAKHNSHALVQRLSGSDADKSWRKDYAHPVDLAFFRLKQGEAMLEWADSLYRSDMSAPVARARELYKAVLWLHQEPPKICKKQLKLKGHSENPALVSQKTRAQMGLYTIESGLNYYGYADNYVPALRYHPLKESADRFASLALASQHSFLAYMKDLEAARLEEMKAQHLQKTTRLNARLGKEQLAHAQTEVTLAEFQVQQVKKAIAAKKNEIEDKNSLFSQFEDFAGGFIGSYKGYKEFNDEVGLFPGNKAIKGSLLTGAGLQGMFGFGLFVTFSYLSLSSMASAANSRQAQLKSLIFEALPAARTMVRLKQTEVTMARLQERIAKADSELAEQLLIFQQRRFLNIEFWSNLAGLIRRVMRRYLELGTRFAWLAERALAYEQRRTLDIIRLDYFPVRQQGVSGADLLRLGLAEMEAARLEGIQAAMPIKHTFSLARDFPLQFGQLKKSAQCTFRTDEAFFRYAYPGTYAYRIRAVGVRVEQVGGGFPICGTMSANGIAAFSQISKGGELLSKTSAHAPSALPISEFHLQSDMEVHELPAEALMPFEGSGVEGLWVIELPAMANPQGLGPMTDILISFDMQADYSVDLHQAYASQLPSKVRRIVMVPASKYAKEGLKALGGSAATAQLDFPILNIGLPKNEKSFKVKNLFLLVVAEPLPDFVATIAIASPQLKADVKVAGNMALSNAPPFTSPQSTTPPSPLNTFVDHSASQTFKLDINKTINPGVDFSMVTDILLGIEYQADIA